MNSFEDIVSGAAGAGWEWFEAIKNPDLKQRVALEVGKTDEDRKAIAAAWARFAASPDGRQALEAMFDTTLRRTVFFATLGVGMEEIAIFGAFREGQNALAHEIARQVARGRETAEQPKPRDIP